MRDALLLAGLSAANYLGLLALAASQARHRHMLIGHRSCSPAPRAALRALSAALIALSFIIAMHRDGPGFGSLVWASSLSVAAFLVVATLSGFHSTRSGT
jgi:hypothetical protein